MKFSILKLARSLVLSISGALLITSLAYADAFIRPSYKGSTDRWSDYAGEFYNPPAHFTNLNAEFGNALFMGYSPTSNYSYVGLPGIAKRNWVFKLQKSTNGEQGGPRKDLVLPSKKAAEDFCNRLIVAANGIDGNEVPSGHTVFVSHWGGGIRRVIAVGYHLAYEGDLAPSTRYTMCPNPWGWEADPYVLDENESSGILASGVADSDKYYYKVVCVKPTIPPATFYYIQQVNGWLSDKGGFYHYQGNNYDPRPSVSTLDYGVGDPYCGVTHRNGTK